jgi:hypothetical protein
MIQKIAVIVACCSVLAMGGEKKLTGNLRLDLTDETLDSLTTASAPHTPHGVSGTKNPFYGGLYSLVLPGAGQYESERYTKAVIFFAAEVALVTYSLVNQHNGNTKTQEFEQYADAHWSAYRYAQYINTYGVADYGPITNFSTADFIAVQNNDFSKINQWESGSHEIGFTHLLPKHGEQQYYELIGKYNQYKFGWDTYPTDGNGVPVSDARKYDEMIPQQMKDYAVERGKANDYYYAAGFAVSAIVINHVISALDAFISTRSYNKEITSSMGMNVKEIGGSKKLFSELNVSVHF